MAAVEPGNAPPLRVNPEPFFGQQPEGLDLDCQQKRATFSTATMEPNALLWSVIRRRRQISTFLLAVKVCRSTLRLRFRCQIVTFWCQRISGLDTFIEFYFGYKEVLLLLNRIDSGPFTIE
jgi:hypothetical protein